MSHQDMFFFGNSQSAIMSQITQANVPLQPELPAFQVPPTNTFQPLPVQPLPTNQLALPLQLSSSSQFPTSSHFNNLPHLPNPSASTFSNWFNGLTPLFANSQSATMPQNSQINAPMQPVPHAFQLPPTVSETFSTGQPLPTNQLALPLQLPLNNHPQNPTVLAFSNWFNGLTPAEMQQILLLLLQNASSQPIQNPIMPNPQETVDTPNHMGLPPTSLDPVLQYQPVETTNPVNFEVNTNPLLQLPSSPTTSPTLERVPTDPIQVIVKTEPAEFGHDAVLGNNIVDPEYYQDYGVDVIFHENSDGIQLGACSLGNLCYMHIYRRRGVEHHFVKCEICPQVFHCFCLGRTNTPFKNKTFRCCGTNPVADAVKAKEGIHYRNRIHRM